MMQFHSHTKVQVKSHTRVRYKNLKYLSMCILLHIQELVYVQGKTHVNECDISDIFTS